VEVHTPKHIFSRCFTAKGLAISLERQVLIHMQPPDKYDTNTEIYKYIGQKA